MYYIHSRYQTAGELLKHKVKLEILQGVLDALGFPEEVDRIHQEVEDSIKGHGRIETGRAMKLGEPIEVIDMEYFDLTSPKDPIHGFR